MNWNFIGGLFLPFCNRRLKGGGQGSAVKATWSTGEGFFCHRFAWIRPSPNQDVPGGTSALAWPAVGYARASRWRQTAAWTTWTSLSGTSRLAQVFCESCSGVTALSGLPGPTDCTGQGFLGYWSHELASATQQTVVSGVQATSFLPLCPDRLYWASGQLVPGCLLSWIQMHQGTYSDGKNSVCWVTEARFLRTSSLYVAGLW